MLLAFRNKSREKVFSRSLVFVEVRHRISDLFLPVGKRLSISVWMTGLLCFLSLLCRTGRRVKLSWFRLRSPHGVCTTRWFRCRGCPCQRFSWWSVWFTGLFTDMFQMLVIVSLLWVPRRIGSLLRFGIFIEVTHRCWASLLASLCNKWGGVGFLGGWDRWSVACMACVNTETLGFHGAFYAFLHIWFTSCSRIITSFCVFLDVEHRSVFRNFSMNSGISVAQGE